MESHITGGRPKGFFNTIKDITGKYNIKFGNIKGTDGKDLTEEVAIKQHWYE